jgi:hypothetical protein
MVLWEEFNIIKKEGSVINLWARIEAKNPKFPDAWPIIAVVTTFNKYRSRY